MREGGGVGDVLKAVDWGGETYFFRVVFDMVRCYKYSNVQV
jgi:hypothetical protein